MTARKDSKATRQLQVRFPAETHALLIKMADERLVSAQLIVVRAVQDFLTRLGPIAEDEVLG